MQNLNHGNNNDEDNNNIAAMKGERKLIKVHVGMAASCRSTPIRSSTYFLFENTEHILNNVQRRSTKD